MQTEHSARVQRLCLLSRLSVNGGTACKWWRSKVVSEGYRGAKAVCDNGVGLARGGYPDAAYKRRVRRRCYL